MAQLQLRKEYDKGVFIIYNRGWYRRETNLIEKNSRKNYATQLFGWPFFSLPNHRIV